jgi:hypothetical protein
MKSMTVSKQPKYWESPHKFMAREIIPCLYKLCSGNESIPDDKQYLTLANIQDKSPSSEVNQIVNSGLCTPKQIVGIDNNNSYIKKNKKAHPAVTFIWGDWNVLLATRQFDPAIVYLDSTHFGDKLPALRTLKNTLDVCGHGTLVVCNVMESNPRSGLGEFLDSKVLLENLLYKEIPAKYKDWNKNRDCKSWSQIENSHIYIPSYTYQTAKTLMKSYIFYKGFMPLEKEIESLFSEYGIWCDDIEKTFC